MGSAGERPAAADTQPPPPPPPSTPHHVRKGEHQSYDRKISVLPSRKFMKKCSIDLVGYDVDLILRTFNLVVRYVKSNVSGSTPLLSKELWVFFLPACGEKGTSTQSRVMKKASKQVRGSSPTLFY